MHFECLTVFNHKFLTVLNRSNRTALYCIYSRVYPTVSPTTDIVLYCTVFQHIPSWVATYALMLGHSYLSYRFSLNAYFSSIYANTARYRAVS